MRTYGEPVSLRVGERTVLIGDAFELQAFRGPDGKSTGRLWFKPYWPGMLHAVALIADGRKRAKQKHP